MRRHRAGTGPGRQDVERQVTREAPRLPQAQKKSDPAAPVVADELDPVEAERVEDGEYVGGHLLLLVSVAARLGRAEAPQVEGQDPVAIGERRQQMAPLVPMLRPAVQAEDDVVARARFGDVELDSARPHRMVRDGCGVSAAHR